MLTDKKKRSIRPRWVSVALGVELTVTASLAGLGCSRHNDLSAFMKEPQPIVSTNEYRLAPPDVVLITSKRIREINGHTEQIRPDGMLTLPLLGTYFVAGKTCEQVSTELQELALEYYEESDVSVRVVGFNSKKIFVWGEVGAPGPYQYDGTNTVMTTLARAQPTRIADCNQIEVLRPNRDGKLVKKMTVNLHNMIEKGDMARNGLLEEGDVIYVPPTPLAAAGLVLQQILLPIQPAVSAVQGPADATLYATGRRAYGPSNSVAP